MDLTVLFEEMENLQLKLKDLGKSPLANICLDQTVRGDIVQNVVSTAQEPGYLYDIDDNIGVHARCLNKPTGKGPFSGKVVWIDYSKEIVWVHLAVNKGESSIPNAVADEVISEVM